MLSAQDIIKKIDHELKAAKLRAAYKPETFDLMGALDNSNNQGQEFALLSLRLWIAEQELPRAARA